MRTETSPEDVGGMHAAAGILTARGGMTSHAAVVARGWGKCCVSGCSDIRVNDAEKVNREVWWPFISIAVRHNFFPYLADSCLLLSFLDFIPFSAFPWKIEYKCEGHLHTCSAGSHYSGQNDTRGWLVVAEWLHRRSNHRKTTTIPPCFERWLRDLHVLGWWDQEAEGKNFSTP